LLADRALTTVDLFYFGWRTMPHANAVGSGYYNDRALLTGPMITANSVGFLAANDERHTVGLRYFGALGAIDFDWQAALQRGTFGSDDVQAFAFNTDTGYTFHAAPWKPRLS